MVMQMSILLSELKSQEDQNFDSGESKVSETEITAEDEKNHPGQHLKRTLHVETSSMQRVNHGWSWSTAANKSDRKIS